MTLFILQQYILSLYSLPKKERENFLSKRRGDEVKEEFKVTSFSVSLHPSLSTFSSLISGMESKQVSRETSSASSFSSS